MVVQVVHNILQVVVELEDLEHQLNQLVQGQ